MGTVWSRFLEGVGFGDKEVRILILGLDNAGKTTILYKLQLGDVVTAVPTIGFNVETIKHNNLSLQVWDLGGQTSIRPYWRCYYSNTDAIIYVVDSCDKERLGIAKEELFAMLEEEELKDSVLCVYANKQDMPDALNEAQVSEALGLTTITDRQWHVRKTSAKNGEGLFEGLDWLCNTLQKK